MNSNMEAVVHWLQPAVFDGAFFNYGVGGSYGMWATFPTSGASEVHYTASASGTDIRSDVMGLIINSQSVGLKLCNNIRFFVTFCHFSG